MTEKALEREWTLTLPAHGYKVLRHASLLDVLIP